MAIEVNPLMAFLGNVERERQRRQQEAAQQQPSIQTMPQWAQGLNPDDFNGATRDMLMKARQASQQQPNAGAKGNMQQSVNRGAMEGPQLAAQAPDLPAPMDPDVMTAPQQPQRAAQTPTIDPAVQRPQQQNGATQAPQGRGGGDWFVGSPGDRVLQARGQTVQGGGGSGTLMGQGGGMGGQPQPQPQPAGQQGGGFASMFGGGVQDASSGPGLGYAIGGIGALLQEAGGQRGAVNDYVTRYQAHHQARTEQAQELARRNKTVARGLQMGIDPDYMMALYEAGDTGEIVKAIHAEQKARREEGKPGAPKLATFALEGQAPRTVDMGTKEGRTAAQRLMAQGWTESKTPAAQVNVNTGPHGEQLPDPEKGMVYARDEQGNTVFEPDPETGYMRPVQVPVGRGSVEREQQAAEQQAAQRAAQKDRYADVVTSNLDTAINRLENSTWPLAGIWSAAANIPGTPQRDLAANLDTIRANVGFDRLQQMRDASPTGGALGQVSELENRLLQSTLGNIEQSQSREQLVNNLTSIQNIYKDIVHGWSPEHITELEQRGEITPEEAAELRQRQPLPYDDFGNPRDPQNTAPAQQQGVQPVEQEIPKGATAVNPNTGERIRWNGREWERVE